MNQKVVGRTLRKTNSVDAEESGAWHGTQFVTFTLMCMGRLLVGIALLAGDLGYGTGSSFKLVVVTERTTITTARLTTVETRITHTLAVTTNSSVT